MNKREKFRKEIVGLLENHTNEYEMAESKSAYISQCITIRQNLERRSGKISKRLTRKLERLKTGLGLSAQSNEKKAEQLLSSYYRQAKTGIDYPGAAGQVIRLLGDNIKEEFLNDVKTYFDGLKFLAEKERRMIAIDSFIQNVENGNLPKNQNELSAADIFSKFWKLDKRYKQEKAYDKVEEWLLKDLKYTVEDVKNKFNITLSFESFTRSARNNRPHNL